jgi:hypothetical protein
MAQSDKFVVKVSDVKKGIVNDTNVLRTIKKQAYRFWWKLPKKTREWYSVQDMVSDGVVFVVSHVAKKFDVKRKTAAFNTYVHTSVKNFYINMLNYFYAKERRDDKTYSLDAPCKGLSDVPLIHFVEQRDYHISTERAVIFRCDARKAFLSVYAESEDNTRKYLLKWLLQPTTTKFKNGEEYRKAVQEFRALSKKHWLSIELCRYIMHDEDLRKQLSFDLVMHFRTPLRPTTRVASIANSQERLLVSLAFSYAQTKEKEKNFGGNLRVREVPTILYA